MKYYVAVDVGATKTRIALCTAENVLDKVVEQTPREGNEYTVAEFIASTVRTRWKSFLDQVESVGVGTIGPIDIRRGRVVYAPNLPLHTFHLLEPLVEELRKPVYVANDAVVAVWGEKHYGLARNHDNVVYVTMSTGIGVGVIVDGHLLIGKAGNAHEAGHIVVDYSSDLPCGCGGRGHWEAYAGGANIPRLARYVYEKTRVKSRLGELLERGEDVTAKTVFDHYRASDKLAELVVETIVKATAAGLASVINVYDPELVILGGSVFLNNVDVLYEPVVKLVKNNLVTEAPEFKPTSLGDDVGLYGALAVAAYTPETLKRIQYPLIMEILSK